MKKISLLTLIIIAPILCSAHYGWWFKNYSILYGGSSINSRMYHSFELQTDAQRLSCTSHSAYKGLALSASFSEYRKEFGLRGFINPTRSSLPITRNIRVFPYFYVQQNMLREYNEFNKGNLNTRPGLGLNGVIGMHNKVTARVQFQAGYSLNQYYISNGNGLVLEFKLGIGLNPNKKRRTETSKQ